VWRSARDEAIVYGRELAHRGRGGRPGTRGSFTSPGRTAETGGQTLRESCIASATPPRAAAPRRRGREPSNAKTADTDRHSEGGAALPPRRSLGQIGALLSKGAVSATMSICRLADVSRARASTHTGLASRPRLDVDDPRALHPEGSAGDGWRAAGHRGSSVEAVMDCRGCSRFGRRALLERNDSSALADHLRRRSPLTRPTFGPPAARRRSARSSTTSTGRPEVGWATTRHSRGLAPHRLAAGGSFGHQGAAHWTTHERPGRASPGRHRQESSSQQKRLRVRGYSPGGRGGRGDRRKTDEHGPTIGHFDGGRGAC